jgi:hypothetical protein
MQFRRIVSCVAVVLAFGAVAYAADMIDNPEYKFWSSCKAGSWVTLKTEMHMNNMNMESGTTNKLLEITAEKAVLESTSKTIMGGKEYPSPATKREIAAKIEKPADSAKPANKPVEGDEELTVDGKKLKCHWSESESEAGGKKTVSRVWMCEEVPGHMTKMESKQDGKVTMTMTVEKFEKK